jgi:hypothetical protein
VKFFVPKVTVGLPAPGSRDDEASAVTVLGLDGVEDELAPHPETANAIAAATKPSLTRCNERGAIVCRRPAARD